MTLGEKIKSIRRLSGERLVDLGSCLNVAPNTVSRWELNESIPRMDSLQKIASHYDVKIDWLLSEDAAAPAINENPNASELTTMFAKLSEKHQHRVLGYIERMLVESNET